MRESSKISIGHFKEAFHGRSGYTMSTTNTDPNKTSNFIKFNWPRFNNPKINFPLDKEENARLDRLESSVIHDIREYGENHPDTIAGIIIEPIQGEGGDNHFRPEFMRNLCDVTHEIGAKFIVDEVQTGTGGTGKMWAYEHAGIKPDMLAFGKRMQVCGLMASDSMREYEDNPFQTSSRINSTWGGNLIDMVRSAWQLEVMEKEKLVENAAKRGDELLKGLNELEQKYSFISNVRGKGVLCAFSLENNSQRNQMREAIYKSGSLVLNSGFESIRLRPSLTLSSDEIGEALNMFDAAAQSLVQHLLSDGMIVQVRGTCSLSKSIVERLLYLEAKVSTSLCDSLSEQHIWLIKHTQAELMESDGDYVISLDNSPGDLVVGKDLIIMI